MSLRKKSKFDPVENVLFISWDPKVVFKSPPFIILSIKTFFNDHDFENEGPSDLEDKQISLNQHFQQRALQKRCHYSIYFLFPGSTKVDCKVSFPRKLPRWVSCSAQECPLGQLSSVWHPEPCRPRSHPCKSSVSGDDWRLVCRLHFWPHLKKWTYRVHKLQNCFNSQLRMIKEKGINTPKESPLFTNNYFVLQLLVQH